MANYGFTSVVNPHRKAARTRAPDASTKGGREQGDKFLGFTPEEQAFADGMAKHRDAFSASAVMARAESHRKKS